MPVATKEESEDNKIRRDIRETIIKMLNEGTDRISIKIHLVNKYPDRIRYIIGMIDNLNKKYKAKKNKDDNSKSQDER